jgi:hypothetical protein
MKIDQFSASIHAIEQTFDSGEGYTLSIETKSRALWNDRAWKMIGQDVVVLTSFGQPDVYIAVDDIESIRPSN